MADPRFSELPAAASFLLTQEFGVNDSGVSRKLTGTQLGTSWGLDFLGSVVLTSAAHETSNLVLTYPPGSGIAATRDFLWGFIRVASYGGSPDPLGDIASLRVNGDSGANYWSRHLLYDGVWNDFQTPNATLIRFAATVSRLSRNVLVTINNLATRSKTFNMKNQTGTNDAAVVGSMNLGAGEWVNAVDQITSVQLVNQGANNMGSGSGMVWMGKNF